MCTGEVSLEEAEHVYMICNDANANWNNCRNNSNINNDSDVFIIQVTLNKS